MAPIRRPSDGLLARVQYPLYSVQMLTSRHVLVAGGGGEAKTGVGNGFEILEIFHDGEKFCAEEVIRHETGPSVVMNCAVRNDKRRMFIVAGQESHCQQYLLNIKVENEDEPLPTKKTAGAKKTEDDEGLRQRKGSQKTSGVENITEKVRSGGRKIKFDVKTGDSVQTDFTKLEPLQRVVRISPSGQFMGTGGVDGCIRIWDFPRMNKLLELKGHANEIDDIDFSPDNKRLVSTAKDGTGIIWSLTDAKQFVKLQWTPPEGVKYILKRCRYGVIEDKKDKYRLFTLANPVGQSGKNQGYIQQWNPDTGRLTKCIGIDESIAALAIRDDGRFLAVGTMFSGSVSIYIAFSLQRVLHIPHAHSMFVTGLDFLPLRNGDGPPISSDSEAAVLSISVDNRICIHSLQYRHALPAWVAILMIIVILFLTFMLCSYIGI